MKVAFLSPRNVIHTVRWVNALAQEVNEVHLISAHEGGDTLDQRVKFYKLPFSPPHGYFLNSIKLRSLLRDIKPDLVNTHFASGYGTLARLSNFSPNVLSVWGADVYDYPENSSLHKWIIQHNLKKADWVCSTSQVMAERTMQLYPVDHLSVTPFGIDTDKFFPEEKKGISDEIVIGTVKALLPKYGIDVLIKSFADLRNNLRPEISKKLRLLIVGEGEQRSELEKLVQTLELSDVTTFTGRVPHEQVPKFLNKFDIYVALSRLESESFGVAILEASSCGLPVVVSDVGGLPEVVMDGKTGYIVKSESPKAASEKIQRLVLDPNKRNAMGKCGRQHVLANYSWEDSVQTMLNVYRKVIRKMHR